jgi:hypothetical protein
MATVLRKKATGTITAGPATIASFEWQNEANGQVGVQIVASALSATLQVQVTLNGSDWIAIQSTNRNSGTTAVNITAAGVYSASIIGVQAVRLQCTAFTSATGASGTMIGMIG